MIIQDKISLGIDISENFISFALLKENAKGITLLKAGRLETPPACISNGNITDSTILAKAIKELLGKHKVKSASAAVSLFAWPTLSQIITLPEDMPSNIENYIYGEIKNSSTLVGKECCYDYCLLSNNIRNSECKVLAQAVSNSQIAPILKAMDIIQMRLTAIELPAHAWVRAAYEKMIGSNYNRNTVVLFSRSSQTDISVFRKGRLDFVRSVDFDSNSMEPEQYIEKFIQELKAVIQYYDVEVETETAVDWQILLYLDNCHYAEDVINRLSENFHHNIELCTDNNIDGMLSVADPQKAEYISTVAVGLALRKLRTVSSKAMINLMPHDIVEINSLKRSALLITNIAAIVMLAIFILTGIKAAKAIDTEKAITQKYDAQSTESISDLFEHHHHLGDSIKLLEEKRAALAELDLNAADTRWSAIMDHISSNIPVNMSITKMMYSSNNTMSLFGSSLAYESSYLFANLLAASDYIETAMVIETNKDQTDDQMVTYRIDCSIRRNGRANEDVD